MLFREQVTHTALIDPPLQPRRAIHGNSAPCQAPPAVSGSDQLLRALLRNCRPRRQDYHQQFLRNAVSLPFLRNKLALINQFVTDHFSNYRNCESVDLSKKVAGCRNMPSIKKEKHKICAKHGDQQSFSYFIIA